MVGIKMDNKYKNGRRWMAIEIASGKQTNKQTEKTLLCYSRYSKN